MKWGKFEIDSFILSTLALGAFLVCLVYACSLTDIEKEKTEQLKIQKEIEYYKAIQAQEANKNE